jgi:primosomal protein N' (replication factor Y)
MPDSQNDNQIIFQIAVDSPAPILYSYLASQDQEVQVGQMVKVPFGRRELLGYVMRQDFKDSDTENQYQLKNISQVVVSEPLFGPELADLIDFVSNYYMYPPGLCVKEILPGGLSPKLKVSYRLTEEGLSQFDSLSENNKKTLCLLHESYPNDVSASKLLENRQKLAKQVKNGLVEVIYEIDDRSKGFSYEWYLSPAPEPNMKAKMGPLEKELYELVKNTPPTPMAHYRQIMPKNRVRQA